MNRHPAAACTSNNDYLEHCMFNQDWFQPIQYLYEDSRPVVIVVTGGGVSAVASLLTVPGASRCILEARIPYAPSTLAEWLGRVPELYCDERTALAMASVACQRAMKIAAKESIEFSREPIGVSCTASLVSDRPKRGEHRCHVAVQSPQRTSCYSLRLEKGARNRLEEDELVGSLILYALTHNCGVQAVPSIRVRDTEHIEASEVISHPLIAEVWQGRRDYAWSLVDGTVTQNLASPPQALICGAFDPLHEGHQRLKDVAGQHLQCDVGFEISITNVDKPPLDFLSIERRRLQFRDAPLALTNAPLFAQKAGLFPNTVFVVGSDTAERIVSVRYYNGDEGEMIHALTQFAMNQCRFLVAGRMVRGQVLTLDQIMIPAQFRGLFTQIPLDEFRMDISSTELRKRDQNADVRTH